MRFSLFFWLCSLCSWRRIVPCPNYTMRKRVEKIVQKLSIPPNDTNSLFLKFLLGQDLVKTICTWVRMEYLGCLQELVHYDSVPIAPFSMCNSPVCLCQNLKLELLKEKKKKREKGVLFYEMPQNDSQKTCFLAVRVAAHLVILFKKNYDWIFLLMWNRIANSEISEWSGFCSVTAWCSG